MSTSVVTGRKSKTATRVKRLLSHLLIIACGAAMIYPLLWMVSSSLKPSGEIFTRPGLIPESASLDNYIQGWNSMGMAFGVFLLNSTFVAVVAVAGNLLSCTLAAYAFARLEFRFRKSLFALMMMTLMLPFHVLLVPQYILFNSLDMEDYSKPLI